jgi:hypothetical protein
MKTRLEGDPQQTAQYIYSIPCECGRSYIGETGRSLAVRLHECRHNLKEGLLEKSKFAHHAYEEGHRVGWDDGRILEIESNSRYRKYMESALMACLINPISHPSHPIWMPSSAMGFLTHSEDMYDGTDSSWFSVKFRSRVFRFYSIDGASGRYYMPDGNCIGHFCIYNFFHNKNYSQIVFHFFGLVLIHVVLLARFVAQISISSFILVLRMCVLYHNLYCIFSCYLRPN